MKRIIYLSIVITLSCVLHIFTQTYMPIASNISIKKDSIFEYFVPPNIPDFLYESVGDFKDMYINSLDIICCVEVDQNQKVNYIFKQPLYGFSNDLCDTSYIWKYVLNSLDSVSKLWVFKPILFKIDSTYSPELVKYYKNINEKVLNGESTRGTRKNGLQSHILYMNIRMPYIDEDEPDFIYFLKVYQ